MEDEKNHDYLRRLDPEAYRGLARVHWTFTIDHRKTGWLDSDFHHSFRERLIHCCFRYGLWCPVYCLMPDHMHLMLMGDRPDSDQRPAMKWLRRRLNWMLRDAGDFELQKQGYDHVLRPKERDRFAFEKMVHYIRENPKRAGLISEEQAPEKWKFQGTVLPGFPEIAWSTEGDVIFWEKFWKLYYAAVERNGEEDS